MTRIDRIEHDAIGGLLRDGVTYMLSSVVKNLSMPAGAAWPCLSCGNFFSFRNSACGVLFALVSTQSVLCVVNEMGETVSI